MLWEAMVRVRLRPGVLDPEGEAIAGSLRALGFAGVRDVRVGRLFGVRLEAADAEEARVQVTAMCRRLLANPVLETFDVEVAPVQETAGAAYGGER